MNNLPKNKNILIAGVVVILLILAAGYFLFFNKSSQNSNQTTDPTSEVPVLTLNADEIGLTLTENAAGNRATMRIVKTEGITSVDYQLSYEADVDGQSVPRGTIGRIDVKTPGQTISEEMIYGTCSDTCHFDEGVQNVKLIVKVTKTDGKVYQVEVTPSE